MGTDTESLCHPPGVWVALGGWAQWCWHPTVTGDVLSVLHTHPVPMGGCCPWVNFSSFGAYQVLTMNVVK